MTMLSSVGIQTNDRFLCGPSLFLGATTAPSLIFILPGLFYIRIIPTDQEPMRSRPKIQVGSDLFLTQRGATVKKRLYKQSHSVHVLLFFRQHVSQHWVSYLWLWALHSLGLIGWAERSRGLVLIKVLFSNPPSPIEGEAKFNLLWEDSQFGLFFTQVELPLESITSGVPVFFIKSSNGRHSLLKAIWFNSGQMCGIITAILGANQTSKKHVWWLVRFVPYNVYDGTAFQRKLVVQFT